MSHSIQVRVTYADTDQMGLVYYGNYLTWFEMGRTELLRAAGLAYKTVEERGVYLPVLEACCRYHRSARYDDLLAITTRVGAQAGATLRFEYQISRGDEVLATGHTVHSYVNTAGRPIRPPRFITDSISQVTIKEEGT
jgi:acyl-CoA thioester hydrolase